MASLYISEYSHMGVATDGVPVPVEGTLVGRQKVSFTGTPGQSAAFGGTTRFIKITADGIFSYLVGSSPTATTSDFRVAADQIVFVGVEPGQKISAVTNT